MHVGQTAGDGHKARGTRLSDAGLGRGRHHGQSLEIHKGRFGLKSIASIPKIAGGYGSVKEFSLTINRKFTYKGKQQSYLLAKCPDGHLNALGTAAFKGGPTVSAEIVRSCTPKG